MSQWRKTIREVMQRPNDDGSRQSYLMPELLSPNHLNYCLIASKADGGFVSVCVGEERARPSHCPMFEFLLLGEGCIAVSMKLPKKSFCFVCCRLASGEKGGDELKRNADVAEILKSTQFPNICKNSHNQVPTAIPEHE
ncbi:hypothetical protein AAC387_Pa01g0143 [Persea americana]